MCLQAGLSPTKAEGMGQQERYEIQQGLMQSHAPGKREHLAKIQAED